MSELATIQNDRIDALERLLVDNFPKAEGELTHHFFDGFYVREFLMKAGDMWTSKIHNTRHPYVIQEGVVSIWVNGQEQVVIASKQEPFEGITEIGTRRILYCHTDVRFFTFHLILHNESLEDIEERIIQKHENKLLISKIN